MKQNKLEKHKHLFTDVVFLIGNGSSRKGFDLYSLIDKGTIIGCNALYRDFVPDILICHDSRMLDEVAKSKYPGIILTDKGHGSVPNKIIYKLKNARTSGVYGLRFISEVIQPRVCFVLGLDGYPGNVYQGTKNYIDPTFKYYHSIVEQYKNIVEKSNTKFININDKKVWGETISYKKFGDLTQR